MKELLVGLGEEKMKMEKGKGYVVDVDVDEERYGIVGCGKVEDYVCREKGE